MRYDPTGQSHPELGDEVTAEGLQHIDNCPECRPLPRADLSRHMAVVDEAVQAMMRPPATIPEFLEARIAEDEAQARAAIATVAPDKWENPTSWGNFFPSEIAFWDNHTPYRILDECAAKRAIIKQAEEATSDRYAVISQFCINSAEIDEAQATDPGELILRNLASVYKDHPEYQAEWAL